MIEAELIERLQRLERANRRLWFIAVGSLALLTAAIGFRAAYAAPVISQKIVAHEFDVVDGSGKVRIRLHTQKNGFAMVQVLDTAGVVQAEMLDNPSGPSMELGFHKVTRVPPGIKPGWVTPDINIGDQFQLGPMISLIRPGAMLGPAVGMGVPSKGQPTISLLDSKGRSRAAMSLFSTGEPRLGFSNESGRDTVRLASLSNGASLEFLGSQDQKIGKYSFPVDRMQLSTWGLYFDDKDGTSAISLGGLKSGAPRTITPSIELSDPAGYSMDLGSTNEVERTTGATKQTSAASIVMFGNDKKHHVIWQAPQ